MRTLSVGSQGKNSYSIFPLSGPKDAGEKETPYPKTSTYLVPLLNETGLKVEKKKSAPFTPALFSETAEPFLCEIYPKNRQYRL